jgi:hypothetical protein
MHSLQEAVALGMKHLDEGVWIVDETSGTSLSSRAIKDIYEAIEGRNA